MLFRFKLTKLLLSVLSIVIIVLSLLYTWLTPLSDLLKILLTDPATKTLLFIEGLFIMISLGAMILILVTFPKIGNAVRNADAKLIGRELINPVASIFGLLNIVLLFLA